MVYQCAALGCANVVEQVEDGWLIIDDGSPTGKTISYCPGRHAFVGQQVFLTSIYPGESADEYDARMTEMGMPVGVVEQTAEIDRLADEYEARGATSRAARVRTPDKNPPWRPEYERERGTGARHEEAYRQRAGMVGILLTCICTWPLDVAETPTGHSEFCPSNKMNQRRSDDV